MTSPSEQSSEQSLDRSLATGIAWTAALRWVAQLVSWLATLYAARLLAPADFGLVSMAMLAIGLARLGQEFGLDAILVQNRAIVGDTHARLAGFVILVGVALTLAFVAIAAPVATFFGEPIVRMIIIGLAPLFIFDALQVVPYAELQRRLEFRRLAIVAFVQVATTAAALAVGVSTGLGLWAIVASKLAGEVAVTLLLLLWQPYRVRWPRELARIAQPLVQGWRVLASRIAWYGYSNADQAIIGKLLGKEALGSYSFAQTFSTLAQQEIGAVISRVVPGIFSEVQTDRAALRRYFLLLTELLTLFALPLAIGLAVTADLFVPLVLGDKWRDVIVPLRILCLYSAFLSAQTLVSHVLLWTGQFRIQMWCSILAGIVLPLALLAAAPHGIERVAWVWAAVFPIVNLPSIVFASRTIGISTREWFAALAPAVVSCSAMAIAVLGLRRFEDAVSWSVLAASVALGAFVYAATLLLAFRRRLGALAGFARTLRN